MADLRYFVLFASSFRYESAPNISHETVDKVRTLCGRKVDDAATFDTDSNGLEADCNVCRKAAAKLRGGPLHEPERSSDEAQLRCDKCVVDHALGILRRPCGTPGCECWCNR